MTNYTGGRNRQTARVKPVLYWVTRVDRVSQGKESLTTLRTFVDPSNFIGDAYNAHVL